MRRCCIVLPTQSVWIAWLSQLACCFAKQAAFQTIDKVHRLFFFLEKLYPENKPNDIVPMSTTHPRPAPTQLFCETIKPSQDLHSLCLKLGYTLESLFSRRCCILRPRKPWNHPWQTWQRRSTLLLCATRTGFSLPGVMKGSKTAQQTVNSLHQAVQHGKRMDCRSGGDSSWYTPQTPLPNHRSGLRPDELRSRSRLLQWKRTENLPAISTLSHTHTWN